MTALLAPALIGATGLGVETSYWYFRAEKAQRAADLAAHAGAIALRDGIGSPVTVAQTEAARQGFAAPTATVAVATPPQSGAHVNDRSVEVSIGYTVDRYFSALFVNTALSRSARAVASFDVPSDACLLALDIDDPGALTLSGAADITLLSCEVMSNSIAPDAVSIGGSSDLLTDCVNAVGGVVFTGGGSDVTLTACEQPRENLSRAPDPYADVPEPSTATPCETLPKAEKGSVVAVTPGAGGVMRFCGGLDVKGDYDFAPGVYVVDGGDFRLNANITITGDDVTFFLTNGAEARFNGSATIAITAPTSGTYQGIAIMGDRADTTASHVFNGTADSLITGAIYTPASSLEFSGNFSGSGGCLQLVSGTLTLTGSVSIETDCAGVGLRWAHVPGAVRLVE